MNTEWSLNDLYKGYDDPSFIKDYNDYKESIHIGTCLTDSLSHDHEGKHVVEILEYLEKRAVLELRLFGFVELSQSVNTTDTKTVSIMDQLSQTASNCSKINAKINRYISEIKDLENVIQSNSLCKEYQFLLTQIKENGKYLLSDEVEEVISKMNIHAGKAWEDLQSYLTSIVDVEFQGEKLTLSAIRNMAYENDAKVRKAAYEAELGVYEKIEDAIAFSLNHIKGQVNTICDLRGYSSVLDMTLQESHMKHETLDCMMSCIEEYLPLFHRYLKRKANLLGYENGLPWYELFAPIGKMESKYTVEEAKTYLLKNFRPFAEDLANLMERAFDERWIDFYPRKGKVGGAFCADLPFIKQSRILTNYDGGLGDIVTLAHELGHAYHGYQVQNHRILNTTYCMPLAETASTFNENIIMNAVIDDAQGDEKIALIENQLTDLVQIICDIYSRYVFESEVFKRRRNGFMFANELKEIMLEAQQKAYGDGLDKQYLHPYMWVCKPHYYSADLSFYNFPYAFGGLFARGLVVKYQEQGDAFVDKYRALLKATSISTVEECAKIADIDLSSRDFWISSLETCRKRIEEFLELTA